MNTLERFEHWAAKARRDAPPPLDVSAAVLQAICYRAPREEADALPLVLTAVLSVLAASVTIALALDSWLSLTDPLGGLFQPLTLVMQ